MVRDEGEPLQVLLVAHVAADLALQTLDGALKLYPISMQYDGGSSYKDILITVAYDGTLSRPSARRNGHNLRLQLNQYPTRR